MWCARCQADVAAEVSAETHEIQCARCGSRLTPGLGDRPSKDPHELLARWSDSKFLDPFDSISKPQRPQDASGQESPPQKHPTPEEQTPKRTRRASAPSNEQAPKSRQIHTFHSAHGLEPHVRVRAPLGRRDEAPSLTTRRVDPGWEIPAPHFSAKLTERERGTHWLSFWGQVCAYGGVALLTGGTAMVLVGYFGGPPDYAPTGWLVNTIGQMLLFLGVITLVSGGLEQTTTDVTSRVDTLGNRLGRLEYLLQREEAYASRDHQAPDDDFDEVDER